MLRARVYLTNSTKRVGVTGHVYVETFVWLTYLHVVVTCLRYCKRLQYVTVTSSICNAVKVVAYVSTNGYSLEIRNIYININLWAVALRDEKNFFLFMVLRVENVARLIYFGSKRFRSEGSGRRFGQKVSVLRFWSKRFRSEGSRVKSGAGGRS